MARSFREVMAEHSPEEQARVHRRATELLEEMHLANLREVAGKTQTAIARKLGISQPAVARMERQTDMLLSTLKGYVEAAGGKLKIDIEFPGATVTGEGFLEILGHAPLGVYPLERTSSCPDPVLVTRQLEFVIADNQELDVRLQPMLRAHPQAISNVQGATEFHEYDFPAAA